MPFDPSNVCARTAAGDAELARPSKGLALAQRKLLAALDAPLILDELATRYGVENARLIRDLEHLTALGLVVVHGSGRSTSGSAARRTPTPVPAAAGLPAAPNRAAPRRRPSRSRRALILLMVAVIMAGGIVLLGRGGAMPSVMGDESPPTSTPRVAVAPAEPRAVSPPLAPARETEPVPVLADRPPVDTGSPVDASPPAGAHPPAVTTARLPAASAAAPVPPAPPTASPPVPEPGPPVPVIAPRAAPAAAPRPATTPEPVPAVASPPPERPAPPVALAAATPSALPVERPAGRPLLPLTQEAPPFPREAIHAGNRQGTVRARLTVDAAGRVTSVAIVDAQPRRVFDRAVTTALAAWTYEPGAPGRTTEVEVVFRRD